MNAGWLGSFQGVKHKLADMHCTLEQAESIVRHAAWAADDNLWDHAGNPALATELLRVTAPTPLLPRVAAASGSLPTADRGARCPVRAGDRVSVRHAGPSTVAFGV